MPETFRVGLLGHGTVGSAFAELLRERADGVEHITGLRPEVTGVLTRSRGSFDEILDGADLVVEVMGGLEPARDYVTRAMKAGKHVVTANKQLLARFGEELWDCARAHDVQLIDDEPRRGLFGLEVAFVHPEATGGVLAEFVADGSK